METKLKLIVLFTAVFHVAHLKSDAKPDAKPDDKPEHPQSGEVDFKKKLTDDDFSCWCDSPDGGKNCSNPYAICDHVNMECADYFDDDFNCTGSEMEYACDYIDPETMKCTVEPDDHSGYNCKCDTDDNGKECDRFIEV